MSAGALKTNAWEKPTMKRKTKVGSGNKKHTMPVAASEEMDVLEGFLKDAVTLLQEIEQCLLTWVANPNDKGTLTGLFRCIHKLNDNADFLGSPYMKHLTHKIETVLDLLKNGTQVDVKVLRESLLKLIGVFHRVLIGISEAKKGGVTGSGLYLNPLDEQIKNDCLKAPGKIPQTKSGGYFLVRSWFQMDMFQKKMWRLD